MSIGHEAGHALHSMLASNHSQLTFHSHTPLAEIASIFGELLLSEKLMEEEKDPQIKQDLLVLVLSELYATIPRQAYFTAFEKEAGHLVGKLYALNTLGAAAGCFLAGSDSLLLALRSL